MSFQQWMAVFFLSGVIVAPAAAFETKPGEWEVETKMSGDFPSMTMPKTKICITPERAKAVPMSEGLPKGCTTKILENKSNQISFEAHCPDQETQATMKKISENEIVSEMTTTTKEGGQKQTMRMTMRQKYIGPTCSK
ncbi:MAG: DUF3617 domain-containing protein [Burkholderiales bacterium]|jgi:hypothetical protein|nr:DUF3617 domain-containing protein [Burkholderiales bacterium]